MLKIRITKMYGPFSELLFYSENARINKTELLKNK